MSVTTLQLTAHDPIIARDGRPFGIGQGNRMRSLDWPLPSVVAGSFRAALVKANPGLDFTKNTPLEVLRVEVAGLFPTVGRELYLPAPNDCVWDGDAGKIYAAKPFPIDQGGCDFPVDGLRPVMYSNDPDKLPFKPKPTPRWWPVGELTNWLLGKPVTFEAKFLDAAMTETRDHVCLDPNTGAVAEGQIFTTAGLNMTYLPKYSEHIDSGNRSFRERFAEITLSARVTISEKVFEYVENLKTWHPLGGERRLVHWRQSDDVDLWRCQEVVKSALETSANIRMVLATPAIFDHGWRPDWLDASTLEGKPFGDGPKLKLVGASIARWKAVSGWAMQGHAENGDGRRVVVPSRGPGPKAIRRMVPAGSVYFFEKVEGDGRVLATNGWLKSVSDAPHDRRDGFGLAVWGIW